MERRKYGKYCKYHLDCGHLTEHYRELSAFLESMIIEGKIKEHIQRIARSLGRASRIKVRGPDLQVLKAMIVRKEAPTCFMLSLVGAQWEKEEATLEKLCLHLHPKSRGKGCFRMMHCISLRMTWKISSSHMKTRW